VNQYWTASENQSLSLKERPRPPAPAIAHSVFAKLIERFSDGVGDQGAEEGIWGFQRIEGQRGAV